MRTYTPLRYPGGKAKLYKTVKKIIENNFTDKPIYSEAYAGGCGLALKLLLNEDVKEIHINDFDYNIYAFWYSIINFKDSFIDLIKDTNIDIEEWHKQKKIYLASKDEYSILEKGFATFFLNRTNRSGILTAGPIGGFKQNGNYKIDCRFNKKALIALIEKIYDYRERIYIYYMDGKDFILKLDKKFNNIFFNLDPPYVVKGAELYKNSFTESDHIKLEEAIKKLKNKWIVTYDNTIFIENLYSKYQQEKFEISYTVETKRKDNEIMIFSENII